MYSTISTRVTSLALGQSYDCPSASEVTLKDMVEKGWYQIAIKHDKLPMMSLFLGVFRWTSKTMFLSIWLAGTLTMLPTSNTQKKSQSSQQLIALSQQLKCWQTTINSFYALCLFSKQLHSPLTQIVSIVWIRKWLSALAWSIEGNSVLCAVNMQPGLSITRSIPRHLADHTFKLIFLNESNMFIQISLKCVPKCRIGSCDDV